jgi:hypothetical protein
VSCIKPKIAYIQKLIGNTDRRKITLTIILIICGVHENMHSVQGYEISNGGNFYGDIQTHTINPFSSRSDIGAGYEHKVNKSTSIFDCVHLGSENHDKGVSVEFRFQF